MARATRLAREPSPRRAEAASDCQTAAAAKAPAAVQATARARLAHDRLSRADLVTRARLLLSDFDRE